jgi:ribosome biogenesis GTPase / thiamine phosphate phosphatase
VAAFFIKQEFEETDMRLEDLGYRDELQQFRVKNRLMDFEIGRIIAEHKESYIVKTEQGEYEAEITGNMRYTARSRADFPAVGDWVWLTVCDADFSVIQGIMPRWSTISRQAIGQSGEVQIIATNVDYALVVQSVDRDFNINRLERYAAICYSSGVNPIIVLTKVDLIDVKDIPGLIAGINSRLEDVPVVAVSNETGEGYAALQDLIERGRTYCMLGSSGVGKSTLLNHLSGKSVMKTGAISGSTHKGKHVTTHRELIVLDSGGILIDNPGMREVGLTDSAQGLETIFDRILSYTQNCRYRDCTHTTETGCAVLAAIENGEIDKKAYENYLKMEKEKAHFESTAAERHKKDKSFGKMVKNYKKDAHEGKF